MAYASSQGPGRRHPGAVLPDGRLNVSLLQREIATDINNDARYKAEDDMKKRAVHSSKDYDEFRKFVSASQLKPVDQSDMAALFSGGGARGLGGGASGTTIAPRNRGGRRRTETKSSGGGSTPKKSASGPICTPAAFDKEWRRRKCCSPSSPPAAVLGLLAQIVPEEAPHTIFRVEIDADVLGCILKSLGSLLVIKSKEDGGCDCEVQVAELNYELSRLLVSNADADDDATGKTPATRDNEHQTSNNAQSDDCQAIAIASFVFRWMQALPQCGRFALAAAFLDDERRRDAGRICDFLEGQRLNASEATFTKEDAESIRRAFLG